jgi:LAO/AO transport system kinase
LKDSQYYIQGVLDKDKRVLSKTITLIESSRSDHKVLSRQVIDSLIPHAGKAVRLGITGVPGAGKSTFIESLGIFLIEQGLKVAVLAVDPSSSRSHGSIMADKTRMEKLSIEPDAFIRPSPSGGTLGGVASKTRETMIACEASGFDVLIVETVGVGQSETTVASMVDFFLVLMISGAGDEIQGIKKGVLELADAVAVNKADGDNIAKAKRARKEYESALHLLRPETKTWAAPVLICSALKMKGIDNIWETVLDHRKKFTETGELEEKRKKQSVAWMKALLEEGIKEWFYRKNDFRKSLKKLIRDVEKGSVSPTFAAADLLKVLDDK